MSSEFKNKTYTGKIRSVQRVIKSIGMSHRVSTHIAQKDHKETEEESHHFILMMRNKVVGMDPDYVINMDQTPIIQALGIEVQHIPDGCTYLCQSVDVGVNKPIEKR